MAFDQRQLVALYLGQWLSLCITIDSTVSSILWKRYQISLPFTQNALNYLLLAIVYAFSSHWPTWSRSTASTPSTPPTTIATPRDVPPWWTYAALALTDVQANAFAVLAFKSTSLLSVLVLSSWTVPCVMLLSCCLGTRYHRTHAYGVLACLIGLAMLIWTDTAGRDSTAHHRWIGDLICLISSTLYAVSNVTEESLVQQTSTAHLLSRLGLWGAIWCSLEAFWFERTTWTTTPWTLPVVLLMFTYVICLFCMYSLVPTVYRLAGATFLSMSLVTSNFYSLLVGVLFLEAEIPALYPLAFACVLIGLVLYNGAALPTRQTYQFIPSRSHPPSSPPLINDPV